MYRRKGKLFVFVWKLGAGPRDGFGLFGRRCLAFWEGWERAGCGGRGGLIGDSYWQLEGFLSLLGC